jgi:hypothetical protein
MPTINTPKQMPTGDGHPTAGNTINDLDFPTTHRSSKDFCSLRAGFALKGHSLHRSDPQDGPVTYWIERWGLVRYASTIDTARRILESIGGRL